VTVTDRGAVERHRADLPLVLPGGAPDLDGRPSETVRDIAANNCWMVLWNVEQVPAWRRLLHDCLDEVSASGRARGPRQAAVMHAADRARATARRWRAGRARGRTAATGGSRARN
jgi:hypothetical protein